MPKSSTQPELLILFTLIGLQLTARHFEKTKPAVKRPQPFFVSDGNHIDSPFLQRGDHTVHQLSANPFSLISRMNHQILNRGVSYAV